jgi:hypothetical protein
MMVFATGILLSVGSTLGQPTTAKTKALDSVYYVALFSGRDPDTAVRKARYTAGTLMKQFGMTRPRGFCSDRQIRNLAFQSLVWRLTRV